MTCPRCGLVPATASGIGHAVLCRGEAPSEPHDLSDCHIIGCIDPKHAAPLPRPSPSPEPTLPCDLFDNGGEGECGGPQFTDPQPEGVDLRVCAFHALMNRNGWMRDAEKYLAERDVLRQERDTQRIVNNALSFAVKQVEAERDEYARLAEDRLFAPSILKETGAPPVNTSSVTPPNGQSIDPPEPRPSREEK